MLCIRNANCNCLDDYSLRGIYFTAIDFNNLKNSLPHAISEQEQDHSSLPVWGYSILYHPKQEPRNTLSSIFILVLI